MMKKLWNRSGQFICCVILWVSLSGQSSRELESLFEAFIADTCFGHSIVSFYLIDLESETELLSRNADISLPPASVLKILTTGAVLERLGSNYTYSTELILDGRIKNDTLYGNIIIRGSGDPTLGSSRFPDQMFSLWLEECTEQIKSRGVRVIKGDLIADASCYRVPGVGETWSYNDLGNYYGAGVYGLNIYDNTYRLVFRQNPQVGGGTTIESISPDIPGLEITNFVVSGPRGSGDQAYIFCAPFQFDAFVKGTIPPGTGTFEIKGSIPSPPLLAVQHLFNTISGSGIRVLGKIDVFQFPYPYGSLEVLGSLRSPELFEIVKIVNIESVNLYAEGLGMELASVMETESSGEAISKHWVERGIDFKGCHLVDASGLSSDNAVTARAVVDIISHLYKDPQMGEKFMNTLPIFGSSGTVGHLLTQSPATGKIHAKSGSINRVRNYAGIMFTSQGPKAFCLLTYNFHCNAGAVSRKLSSFLERVYIQCSK